MRSSKLIQSSRENIAIVKQRINKMSRNFVVCFIGAIWTFCLVAESVAAAGNIVKITNKPQFLGEVVSKSSKKPVIVFFYSPTECGSTCTWFLLPTLEGLIKNKSALHLAVVDLDKVPDFRSQHGITQIPTTLIFHKGGARDRVEGKSWSKMEALVTKASMMARQQ